MKKEKFAGKNFIAMKKMREKEPWCRWGLSKTEKSGELPDYHHYELNFRERFWTLALGILLLLAISWLFYRSFFVAIFFSPLLIFFLRWEEDRRKRERLQRLSRQFRDGMQSLASAMSVGYSPENAFGQAQRELAGIYGEKGLLVWEFSLIRRRLAMNQTVEEALGDLASRSGIADIQEMSQVFSIAKRSGGSLPEILRATARTLEEKGQLEEEIRTMLAGRRLEQRIMCLMPAGILLYMTLANPGFLDPLYEGVAGRIVMTLALGVYGLAIWLGEKMLKVSL